ncbi:MAG: ATP-binding cassette subfamily C protein [Arenicella sp.]|jgi:ATP-binding cassette subfamily C protein
MNATSFVAIKSLVEHCLKYAPLKVVGAMLLMLLSSVTSGVGILLIVPLLASMGIDVGRSPLSSNITDSIGVWMPVLSLESQLHSVLLLYLLLIVAVASFSFFNSVMIMSIKQVFVIDLRQRLSRSLFYTQWRHLNKQHMSDYMRVLTGQVNQAGESLVSLLNLVSGLVLTVIYLIFAFFVSLKLTLIALILAAFLGVLLLPLNSRILASGVLSLRSYKRFQRSVFENTSSLKMIKSFSSEELYLRHLHENSRLLELQKVRIAKYNAWTRWLNLVGGAFVFAILFYAAIEWLKLPLANLLILLFIFSRLMPQVSNIQKMYQNLIHKSPLLLDLNEALFDLQKRTELRQGNGSDVEGKGFALFESLELVNVCYQHDGDTRLTIDNLSVSITANDTVAIIGSSGVGKSTLADIISGLIKPTSGELLVDGVGITEFNCMQWRKHVAYVTQEVFLFHQSVRDNLSWVCDSIDLGDGKLTDQDLWRALDQAHASEFVKKLPEGLNTLVGDRGVKLSGGQRQRLALARAILSNPDLLILDEATSALDYESEINIRDALIKLNGKMTIIIIAHNENTIEHVSQRITLREA